MSEFIRLDNITISYENKIVFCNKSLSIPAETRILAICGASGSGKTTLLRALAGLHKPTNGSIYINSHKVDGVSRSLAFLSQSLALFPWKTVVENVEFGLLCQGMQKKPRRYLANEMLERLNMAHCGNDFVHQLSTGMQQRVAFARAVVVKPKCVFLDEPFSSLDYATTSDLCVLLSDMAAVGSRYVVITHDVRAAAFLADSLLLIEKKNFFLTEKLHHTPHPRDKHFFLTNEHHHTMSELISKMELKDI